MKNVVYGRASVEAVVHFYALHLRTIIKTIVRQPI